MPYLLDTNVLSEPLKKEPNAGVIAKIAEHRNLLATAAPVWHELRYGGHRLPRSRKREKIETYLNQVVLPTMDILPYDERAAEWHARERARLEASGRTPPYVDGQIASIAIVNGYILVTRNVKDYELFSDLKIENWY